MRKSVSVAMITGCAALAMAACNQASATRDHGGASATNAAAPVAANPDTPTAPAPKAAASTTELSTADYEFSYSYPAVAVAIPALASQLDADRKAALASLKSDTAAARREAEADGYPYRAYGYDKEWKQVADLPGWLSLSAQGYVFSGGAHGQPMYDSLLWDKAGNHGAEPVDVFTSKAAINAALKNSFCIEIDKQRLAKRGTVLGEESGFTDCLDPADFTLLLGSSNRKTFDRIGILVDPYSAGPYAEGMYEVTLPVTPALWAAVKPRFRSAFSVKR